MSRASWWSSVLPHTSFINILFNRYADCQTGGFWPHSPHYQKRLRRSVKLLQPPEANLDLERKPTKHGHLRNHGLEAVLHTKCLDSRTHIMARSSTVSGKAGLITALYQLRYLCISWSYQIGPLHNLEHGFQLLFNMQPWAINQASSSKSCIWAYDGNQAERSHLLRLDRSRRRFFKSASFCLNQRAVTTKDYCCT